MKNTGQVNGLYPIIRRVRRPLLPVDLIPDGQQSGAKPAQPSTEAGEEIDTSTAPAGVAKESAGQAT